MTFDLAYISKVLSLSDFSSSLKALTSEYIEECSSENGRTIKQTSASLEKYRHNLKFPSGPYNYRMGSTKDDSKKNTGVFYTAQKLTLDGASVTVYMMHGKVFDSMVIDQDKTVFGKDIALKKICLALPNEDFKSSDEKFNEYKFVGLHEPKEILAFLGCNRQAMSVAFIINLMKQIGAQKEAAVRSSAQMRKRHYTIVKWGVAVLVVVALIALNRFASRKRLRV